MGVVFKMLNENVKRRTTSSSPFDDATPPNQQVRSWLGGEIRAHGNFDGTIF
jgi:hypothetical protein